MTKEKVYLAHSISTRGEFEDSKRVAGIIRDLGYDVYAAADNDSINDKRNEPTPIDIYNGDVSEIITSDIFVVNLSGGLQDGTISEVGVVAGYNEATLQAQLQRSMGAPIPDRSIKVIGYTTNARLARPQFHKGIPSASANHLVLGIVERWGEFVGGEDELLLKLREMA